MDTTAHTPLLKLSDSNLTVAPPDVDIRGRRVLDCAGEHLGPVVDLLLDAAEHKVRFLEVAADALLGPGGRTVLLPVDAIQRLAPSMCL